MWNTGILEVLLLTDQKQKNAQLMENLSSRVRLRHFYSTNIKDLTDDILSKIDILLIDYKIDNSHLEKAVNLKWIQFLRNTQLLELQTIHFQHPEVLITTNEGVSAFSAAQHAMAMLLMLSLNYHQNCGTSENIKPNPDFVVGLQKRTVGILGYGATGQILARLLKPLQPIILASSYALMKPANTTFVPECLGDPDGNLFDRLYPVQALTSMAKSCDFFIITDHMPTNLSQLLTHQIFEQMPRHGIMVDISHQWADEHILNIAHAVKIGDIHAAGVDITEYPSEKSKVENDGNFQFFRGHQPSINQNLLGPKTMELIQQNLERFFAQEELLNLFINR